MKFRTRQLAELPSARRASLGGVRISTELAAQKSVQKLKEKFDSHAMDKQR
jgi:hypothetical protein